MLPETTKGMLLHKLKKKKTLLLLNSNEKFAFS